MQRLSERGPDGWDVFQGDHFAMGHWHFWTTPEEVGERQPLELTGLPYMIVLDGRLDNRPELINGLKMNPLEGSHLSDAALMLHAYDRWGQDCFKHFIGEFAIAILDQRRGELLCARDALGDRTLFYSCKETRIVIASEPWAVAGADVTGTELNESAVAHLFALRESEDGQTYFKNIYEILPAHGMLVNGFGERHWRYWEPNPSSQVRYNTDDEYAERFRELLEESVRCRMRSTTPVGVLMSGGLDSTSVACLAARMLRPQALTTISYVFDELVDCDERQYIDAVKKEWGIRSIQLPCDNAWPLKDWQQWPHNPNQPEENPYRLLRERAYQKAKTEGLRVLLTGGFGDHLYSAGSHWFEDLIVNGHYREAGRELRLYFRYSGWRWTLQAGFLQHAARRMLNFLPRRRTVGKNLNPPAWLTPFSAGYLAEKGNGLDPTLERYSNMIGLDAAASSSGECSNASRHSLELRHPYRDLRLVEYVLSIPAYQLYYHGLYKHILRKSMRGILPDLIRARRQPTSLEPLYLRGAEREKDVFLNCFKDLSAVPWSFINTGWLFENMDKLFLPEQNGSGAVIPWLCVSFERWYQLYISNLG